MSEKTYRLLPQALELTRLCTYTGENLPILGSISVLVCYNQQKTLPIREGPNLLGRDWLEQLQLDYMDNHYKLHYVDDTRL